MTLQITRAEFAAVVVVRVYERLTGTAAVAGADPFTDTDEIEVLKAFNEGLAVGVSGSLFEPDSPLDRE